MSVRSWHRAPFVFLPLLISAAIAATSAAPPAPHVRFFADGIDIPMSTFYEAVGYAKECVRRYPKECSRALEIPGAGPVDMPPESLDLGSLFATARSRAPAPVFDSMEQATRKMVALMARMESEAQVYEFELYVRVAALYSGCSGDHDERLHLLGSLYRADVLHFQGRSEADLKQSVKRLDQQAIRTARLIREQWTPSICQKALTLSRHLERAMYHRIKPVYPEDFKPLTRIDRQGLLLGQIWEVAAVLAREHEPAVAKRLDAYEGRLPVP
jgi:hypothetical protein